MFENREIFILEYVLFKLSLLRTFGDTYNEPSGDELPMVRSKLFVIFQFHFIVQIYTLFPHFLGCLNGHHVHLQVAPWRGLPHSPHRRWRLCVS